MSLTMNIIDYELEINKIDLKHHKKMSKYSFIASIGHFSISFISLTMQYYSKEFNWLGGFTIGINISCMIIFIFNYVYSKEKYKFEVIKHEKYTNLKKQLADTNNKLQLNEDS